MAHHIERLFREASDEVIGFTIFGADGTTPIDSDIVDEIKLWMRDLENNTEVAGAQAVDVTSQLGPDGAMLLEVPAAWLVQTPDTDAEQQLRMITLRIKHSGDKTTYEEITFHLDAMQDVPATSPSPSVSPSASQSPSASTSPSEGA